MDQKAFAIVFISLTVIGAIFLTFSKITQEFQPSPSPNPLGQLTPPSGQPQQAKQQLQAPASPQTRKYYPKFPGILPASKLQNKKAVMQTSKGAIEFEIYPEATNAASNFVTLSEDKFYEGLTFHRVEPGFVVQGGDPKGNGTGGPGYVFDDDPVTRKYLRGTVAMANSGPNTNGSQFFIMLEDKLDLPPRYTIFGKVLKGQEVVETIQPGDLIKVVTISPLK